MTMETNINEREVAILRNIPKSHIPEFIEKNWQKLRELLTSDEELNDLEILECLIEWYKWL